MTIRRFPQDFAVIEVPSPAFAAALADRPSPRANHAVYQLDKLSLTTPQACSMLARQLGLRDADIAYAGLKDKHAKTTQWVSAPWQSPKPPTPSISQQGWSAQLLGFAPEPIQTRDIVGNAFRIVVRGLSPQHAQRMDHHARSLAHPSIPRTLLVLNYFGAQRFGSARHGRGFVARALIADDFDLALRLAIGTPARKDTGSTRAFTRLAAQHWGQWKHLTQSLPRCPERKPIEALAQGRDAREAFTLLPYFLQSMYVEAFQSLLWNQSAFKLARSLATPARPCIEADDDFGPMLFPCAEAVPRALLECSMPLLAPGTELRDPWAQPARDTLADHGLALSDLRVPGLRRPFFGHAERPLFTLATDLSIGPPTSDDAHLATPERPRRRATRASRLQRTIAFHLPRGSYATVVLRALGQ